MVNQEIQNYGNFKLVQKEIKENNHYYREYSLFYDNITLCSVTYDYDVLEYIKVINYDTDGNLWIIKKANGQEELIIFDNTGSQIYCKFADFINIFDNSIHFKTYKHYGQEYPEIEKVPIQNIIEHISKVKFYKNLFNELYNDKKVVNCDIYNDFCIMRAKLTNDDNSDIYCLFYKDKLLTSSNNFINIIQVDKQNNVWIHIKFQNKECLNIYNDKGLCVFSKSADNVEFFVDDYYISKSVIFKAYDLSNNKFYEEKMSIDDIYNCIKNFYDQRCNQIFNNLTVKNKNDNFTIEIKSFRI